MKALPRKVLIISVIIISLLIAFLAINYFIWRTNYQGKFYPGESIGGLILSGKTREEAKKALAERFQQIIQDGFIFKYNKETKKLDLEIVSFDSDLALPTLTLNLEESLTNIFDAKKQNSFLSYLTDKFIGDSNKNTATIQYSLDETAVKSFLADNFKELDIPAQNAYFSLTKDASATEIVVNQERPGKGINYNKIFADIHDSLIKLEAPTINIQTTSLYPEIKRSDLVGLEAETKNIIGRGEFTINFTDSEVSSSTTKYWEVKPDKLTTWISLKKNGSATTIYLDQEKIKEYLITTLAPEIDKDAALPRFEIRDGKVSDWQTGKNGLKVDLEASAQAITSTLLGGQNEIGLITKEVSSQNITPDNNLQINEIIGTGHSNFAGSPTNRRKNIKNGADALQGILIQPNEEFSLIKTLGTIDASTGYLQELVIKGNKTVPEFGGGLCQIGTTVFRAALGSGLPITMRQNHSYRVAYYEPAGMDATIYDPKPDLRFINDTGNYILIQARIVKDDLYFDFWGTKDGRIATTTYPTIYNIVKPAPTKIIETTDLTPGQKKCTESSHNGADAFFDYKVIYPEGSTTTPIQERRFSSHYVPWQGVCLLGVTATSSAITTASSTAMETPPLATTTKSLE